MKRIDEWKSMQTHFKVLLYSFGAIHRKTIETYSADLLIFLRKKGAKKRFSPERPGRSRRTHGHLMYLFTYCRTASTVLGTNSLDLVWGNFCSSKAVFTALFFHILKSSKRSRFVITLCTRRAFSFYQQPLAVKLDVWKFGENYERQRRDDWINQTQYCYYRVCHPTMCSMSFNVDHS